jgi:hypothetical protein
MQLEARLLFWDGIISNFMFLNSEKNMCVLLYMFLFEVSPSEILYIGCVFHLTFVVRVPV